MPDKYKFFWRGKYSQWYKSPMYDPTLKKYFNCAEQYMMYRKAALFNDDGAKEGILNTDSPKEMQNIGRSVRNFDQSIWESHREDIVTRGNYLKFTQNLVLLEDLLTNYRNHSFVEASPFDLVWGVGLEEEDPRILDKSNWRGLNLLGKCIDKARNKIVLDLLLT